MCGEAAVQHQRLGLQLCEEVAPVSFLYEANKEAPGVDAEESVQTYTMAWPQRRSGGVQWGWTRGTCLCSSPVLGRAPLGTDTLWIQRRLLDYISNYCKALHGSYLICHRDDPALTDQLCEGFLIRLARNT